MNTPLKLVWKFDSCLDLNTPWIWTETWFKQASSWVKTKIWWWKCDYSAEISYIVDISLPEISCVFQMFTFVTSCCSPHISTSQQKSSTECLIWCCSGCVRILPFDMLQGLCHSTVSYGQRSSHREKWKLACPRRHANSSHSELQLFSKFLSNFS